LVRNGFGVYNSTIKWLDICLAISKKFVMTRRALGKVTQLTHRTLENRFYNTISTSAGVHACGQKSGHRGLKSDQRGRNSYKFWQTSMGENYLVSNPKLFPTNALKSVLVGNPFAKPVSVMHVNFSGFNHRLDLRALNHKTLWFRNFKLKTNQT
jgi:hypothetical protein